MRSVNALQPDPRLPCERGRSRRGARRCCHTGTPRSRRGSRGRSAAARSRSPTPQPPPETTTTAAPPAARARRAPPRARAAASKPAARARARARTRCPRPRWRGPPPRDSAWMIRCTVDAGVRPVASAARSVIALTQGRSSRPARSSRPSDLGRSRVGRHDHVGIRSAAISRSSPRRPIMNRTADPSHRVGRKRAMSQYSRSYSQGSRSSIDSAAAPADLLHEPPHLPRAVDDGDLRVRAHAPRALRASNRAGRSCPAPMSAVRIRMRGRDM